jgi:hypothetical protein
MFLKRDAQAAIKHRVSMYVYFQINYTSLVHTKGQRIIGNANMAPAGLIINKKSLLLSPQCIQRN